MSSQLIEQVKLQYKQSLADKAENLSKLYKSSGDNPDELLSFLHQLAGSAGMYGYDLITDMAADLQNQMKSSNSKNLSNADVQKLHQLLINSSKK